MITKTALATFGIILCLGLFTPSFALPANPHFYVKGIADKDGPFAGQYVRILGNEHQGTILFTTTKGLGIIRLNLSDTVECYTFTSKICLTGVVTATKNIGRSDVGDVMRLSLDTQGKKQMVSFLDGTKVSSTFSINFDPKPKKDMPDMTSQRFVFYPEEKEQSTRYTKYADQKMSDVIAKARQFTETHPTFLYDGIPDSLNLNLVSVLETKTTPVYIVEASFDSRFSGYGDRTEQYVAQQITPHTMRVMISERGISSAIIDGVWDEVNQGWQK